MMKKGKKKRKKAQKCERIAVAKKANSSKTSSFPRLREKNSFNAETTEKNALFLHYFFFFSLSFYEVCLQMLFLFPPPSLTHFVNRFLMPNEDTTRNTLTGIENKIVKVKRGIGRRQRKEKQKSEREKK